MKTRIALMFGGRSVEHEVSVISGIQAYVSIDKEKYEVTPVYLTKNNEMYVGEDIGIVTVFWSGINSVATAPNIAPNIPPTAWSYLLTGIHYFHKLGIQN